MRSVGLSAPRARPSRTLITTGTPTTGRAALTSRCARRRAACGAALRWPGSPLCAIPYLPALPRLLVPRRPFLLASHSDRARRRKPGRAPPHSAVAFAGAERLAARRGPDPPASALLAAHSHSQSTIKMRGRICVEAWPAGSASMWKRCQARPATCMVSKRCSATRNEAKSAMSLVSRLESIGSEPARSGTQHVIGCTFHELA